MTSVLNGMTLAVSVIRLIPHTVIFTLSPKTAELRADVERWARLYPAGDERASNPAAAHPIRSLYEFVRLMTFYPEFRSIFYFRTGFKGKVFALLCRPMSTLFIMTRSIGPGLFIQHGFATIVAARSIGRNCWINQQVTIGYTNAEDCPTIGDNVTVSAGAKVIGNVTIGDNARIGANAVVVKDVPPNVTVVGVPAYIVKRDGVRVTERL